MQESVKEYAREKWIGKDFLAYALSPLGENWLNACFGFVPVSSIFWRKSRSCMDLAGSATCKEVYFLLRQACEACDLMLWQELHNLHKWCNSCVYRLQGLFYSVAVREYFSGSTRSIWATKSGLKSKFYSKETFVLYSSTCLFVPLFSNQ